jgi:thioredoxin reductase (NADPH)
MDMAANNEINLLVNSEVTHLEGSDSQKGLQRVGISTDEKDEITWVDCDYFLPLFGLSPKLGPIADWGLNINKSAIEVNTFDYSTNIPGIYAIGDVNTYPGKLKLILCGFHEATLMVQSAFKRIHPDKNNVLKYTTVNGVQGF